MLSSGDVVLSSGAVKFDDVVLSSGDVGKHAPGVTTPTQERLL